MNSCKHIHTHPLSLSHTPTHKDRHTHTDTHTHISKVKLATLVEGYQKAPFSIATTPRCTRGRYSLSWIAPLYP